MNGLVRYPLGQETEIPKVPQQDHVDNFFDSQGIVNTELVTEGITLNAEFYKRVMDRLKRMQRFRSAVQFFLVAR
jgi:hypothetical protein